MWSVGLILLVRREYFRPHLEQLATAAMRVNPGAVYFGVVQNDRQLGFASSTIDTAQTEIVATDYFVADVPVAGKRRRAAVRTRVVLSRGLRLRTFDFSLNAEGPPFRAIGRVDGDTVLVIEVTSGSAPPDTQRVPLTGPILLPTMVPLAIALGERPTVGKEYVLPVFDPVGLSAKDLTLTVRAESVFVLNDSSSFDAATRTWRGTYPDTVRGWHIAAEGAGGFSGWIDEQGRIIGTSQLGFELRRLPYEQAFGTWRLESERQPGSGTAAQGTDPARDIYETTAIAANQLMAKRDIGRLVLRLENADIRELDLDGDRQRLSGDTVTITREPRDRLSASYTLPSGGRALAPAFTRPEPLIQSRAIEIVRLAIRLRSADPDPVVVAERISRWVHDSIRKEITFGIPSALDVLRSRAGDGNEHTQLFVALARAAGIPARTVAGLAFINGKFYYHAWPEVLFDRWVAVDPTFGEFPADAAHLRLIIGGLNRQVELLRLMGTLGIDVVRVN
jgi:hypothetical protein